jgi:hypothetical protein
MVTKLSPGKETSGKDSKPVMTEKKCFYASPTSHSVISEQEFRATMRAMLPTKALLSILIYSPIPHKQESGSPSENCSPSEILRVLMKHHSRIMVKT